MKKYNVTVNGITYEVLVEEVPVNSAPSPSQTPPPPVQAQTQTQTPPPPQTPAAPAAKGNEGSIKITAPMPGTVLKINAEPGQTVKKDDLLYVLEAMKMENEIFASESGTVASINVSQGTTVNSGDLILTLN